MTPLPLGRRRLARRSGHRRPRDDGHLLAVGVFYFWTAATSPDPGRSYHSLLADAFRDGGQTFPSARARSCSRCPIRTTRPRTCRTAFTTRRSTRAGTISTSARRRVAPLPAAADRRVWRRRTAGWSAARPRRLRLLRRAAAVPRRSLPPRTPTAWRLVAVAGLGLGNVVPFMLRRPEVYEISIAAGLLFLMLAALLLVVGALRERPLAAADRARQPVARARGRLAGEPDPRRPAPRLGVVARSGTRADGGGAAPRARPSPRGGPSPRACCCWRCTTSSGSARPPSSASRTSSPRRPTRASSTTSISRVSSPGAWFYVLQPPDIGLDFPFITLEPGVPGDPSGGLLRRARRRRARRGAARRRPPRPPVAGPESRRPDAGARRASSPSWRSSRCSCPCRPWSDSAARRSATRSTSPAS